MYVRVEPVSPQQRLGSTLSLMTAWREERFGRHKNKANATRSALDEADVPPKNMGAKVGTKRRSER